MIRDNRTTFSFTTSPTALNTGAPGSYFVGDVIDLSVTGRDIGAGEGIGDVFLYIVMSTAAAGATATLQMALVTSDNSNLSSGTVVVQTAAIPVATLTSGYVVYAARLPAAVYKRYIGLQQTTGTAAFSAGSFYAFLAEDANAIRFYPQAFS